jgi:hypothetical protein
MNKKNVLLCAVVSGMMTLAGPVTKPSDLDLRSDLVLPMDVISAFRANLEPFGITLYVHTTYRVAC